MASNENERETWVGKLDFILALIGFSVGLGNIWRFPYLCFKNGGGCFLIPYLICLVLAGVPILILEVSLGQFTSQGGITAWKICPLFQGIGYASVVIVQFLNIYYIVILGWALFYLFASFTSKLPWSHCDNPWNTPQCVDLNGAGPSSSDSNRQNVSAVGMLNATLNATSNATLPKVSSSQEYLDYRVLRLSGGLDEPGIINWDLALCLLLGWIICYLCVWKGVKSTGRVWLDAGTQVFFSYSIGLGTLIALGSYNKFRTNCYRDCIIFACVNSGTSLYGGFVIFSILGFMAQKQDVPVAEVAKSGPGLAFVAYPAAVAEMPVAPLWSILFFFMVILLGLDSEFVGVEGFVTAIVDLFPHYLRRGYRKEIFIAICCFFWFLIGLSMVSEGGMYVFQLFDTYSASGSALLWVSLFQSIAVGWVYGGDRFYDNLESMIGFRINPWSKLCWKYFTPLFCLAVFVFSLVTYKPLEYNKFKYPAWGQVIGWCMALASILCIPIYIILKLYTTEGTFGERWKKLTTPTTTRSECQNKDNQQKCKEEGNAVWLSGM